MYPSHFAKAFWAAEREAEEKARIKREDRVLKQWTRLIHGLRIRQRLQDQYASKQYEPRVASHKPTAGTHSEAVSEREDAPHDVGTSLPAGRDVDADSSHAALQDDEPSDAAGGFLAGADKVVQAFHLPRNTHVVLPPSGPPSRALSHAPGTDAQEAEEDESEGDAPDFNTYDLEDMDVDVPMEDVGADPSRPSPAPYDVHVVPKTLQQMAEEADMARMKAVAPDPEEEEITVTVHGPTTGPEPSPLKNTLSSSNTSTPNTRASANTNASSRSTRSSARAAAVKGKGESKAKAKSKTTVRRGKRARKASDDNDEDEDEVTPSSASASEAESSTQHEDTLKRKRAAATSNGRAEAPPTATTRTLRPRAAKSASQLEEERQREAAYRKAVAR